MYVSSEELTRFYNICVLMSKSNPLSLSILANNAINTIITLEILTCCNIRYKNKQIFDKPKSKGSTWSARA